jgi:hypothetical protein
VSKITEMGVLEQEEVRDIIRNATLHILNEYAGAPKGT